MSKRVKPRQVGVDVEVFGKSVTQLVEEMHKKYGTKAVTTGTDLKIPGRISTGIFMLDFALLGGIPEGRGTMVVGEKSHGKSLLTAKTIAQAQMKYPTGVCVLVDIEGTYDPVWGAKLGIDNDRLLVIQPQTAEASGDIIDLAMQTDDVVLVVVDSIAQMVPQKELEASLEDQFVGIHARLINRVMRVAGSRLITERQRGHTVTVVYVNQYRMKVGVIFGDPRTVPGGKGIEYLCSVVVGITGKQVKGKDTRDAERVTHNEHAFTIKKNKINNGPLAGEFNICRMDDPERNLKEGDADDSRQMLAYAKKFGLFVDPGGKAKKILTVDEVDYEFAKIADAIDFLNMNKNVKWSLRCMIIAMQGVDLGMPEEFCEIILNEEREFGQEQVSETAEEQ